MVPASQVADRVRVALELYEVGESMLRQRLRRERPDASAQDALLGPTQSADLLLRIWKTLDLK
jgi:Rv0078B-related antitoxin